MPDRDPSTDATISADEVSSSPESLADVAPTLVAGRYEIRGLLGAGGMGRVYRAFDRELRENVALKVLHRDLVDSAEMVERFRQEVRLARRVTHRNVARTFDIGEHDGEKFLTMELVAGEPLSARLERGALPLAETLAIARDIAAGMGAAHAVGVVHRDLKPDNVLVEDGGRVVITDFGIARADLGDASRTSGRTVGTPAYMAPEQIGGTVDVDARADVYAFGAILFEMLTGVRAWPGSSALAVAAARLVEPPPDPRKHAPALSPRLADVVLKCLARDRDERFSSAADVANALAGDPTIDAAIPAPPRAPVAPSSRDRAVAVLPFRNFGPPEDAYFVEGLTEDLVDVLATVRGLRVRGRASPDAADRDVVDTGRRLGVDVVVEGSVRRAGDTLRVNARAIGVADGFQIWSSRFDRPSGAAFALNDEVAHAIAAALSAEHLAPARPLPTDPVAVDLYFKAKHAIGRFWSTAGQNEAQTLFREALARAPTDPTILAGYISAQIGRNFFAPLDPAEARALLHRALTAGGSLAEPWVALAAVRFNHADDPAGAIRALKRALSIAPSSAEAHDLTGRILLEADVRDDAIAHLERTLWLDPSQRWARIDLMRAAALVGDWTRATEIFESGTGPEWAGHRLFHRARLWSWPGAPEVGRTVLPPETDFRFRKLVELFDDARESKKTGRPRSMDEIRSEMDALAGAASPRSRARRFFHQQTAEQAALSGHFDGALESVRGAVDAGLLDLAWINRLGLLDPLRSDARFEALRREVERRAARVAEAWRGPEESLETALAALVS